MSGAMINLDQSKAFLILEGSGFRSRFQKLHLSNIQLHLFDVNGNLSKSFSIAGSVRH